MCQNAKLVNTDTCGGLAIVAGIIGWNYMHHLGKMEEKKKKMVKQHYTLMTSEKGKGLLSKVIVK